MSNINIYDIYDKLMYELMTEKSNPENTNNDNGHQNIYQIKYLINGGKIL